MAVQDESRRRHPRFSTDQVTWVDGVDSAGNGFRLVGRCIDESRGGMCVTLPREVPVGSMVRVGLPTKGARLDCKVCHCLRSGDRFKIGLQFKLSRDEAGQADQRGREHSRISVSSIAWVEVADPLRKDYRIAGRCLDVSKGGVCVRVPQTLEIGALVRIGVPSERIQAQAEVRNCTEIDGQFEVGLRFKKD